MISFETIIGPLTAALGLSVLLERVLEFLSNLWERSLRSYEGRKIPKSSTADQIITEFEKTYAMNEESKNAEQRIESTLHQRIADKKRFEATEIKITQIADKLASKQYTQKRNDLERKLEDLEETLKNLKEKLNKEETVVAWDEQVPNSTILVEPSTDPDDGLVLKRFVLQILGFALGIIFVRLSGIQLFNNLLIDSSIPEWQDYLFTGLLIGAGSAPVHVLIRFITERKIIATEDLGSAEEEELVPHTRITPKPAEALAVISRPSDASLDGRMHIPYAGGVDREKLQGIHKRPANPDMIIYHHTAMNRRSTFEDVVRVIKSRKDPKGNPWVTGYNCVIQETGSIHPFCRWDRYGNHAAGCNRRSLGIAFIGNFETDPAVPYSNPDGRMGPAYPTESQLKAGARVVALWIFLYSIDINFTRSIVPHKKISTKTCPGSGFPYNEFERWIKFYCTRWAKSTVIKDRIKEFKQKPCLYV